MPFGSGGPGFTGGKGNIDGPLTITGVISSSSPITSSGIQIVNHPGDGDTLTLTHNGTDARVISSTGDIHIIPAGDDVIIGDVTDDSSLNILAASNKRGKLTFSEGGSGNIRMQIVADYESTTPQALWVLGEASSRVNHTLAITSRANVDKSHDHAPQDDPTLFIHSITDPDTNNSQFVGLHHDRTDGRIVLGTGKLIVSGTHGDAYRGENAAAGMEVHGSTGLVVKAADGDNVALRHDGTNANLISSAGDIILKPAGADVEIKNDSGPARFHVVPSAGEPAQITFSEASTSAHMFSIEAINNTEELLLATNARTGRAIIITNVGSIGEDHQHGVQTDPTLYIHSVTDPGEDSTEWGSLSFSSANDEFNIDSAGKMQISTTGPELFLGNAVNAADVRIQGGTSAQQTSLGFYEGSTRHMVLGHKASIAQNVILVDDGGGNQLVFGNGSFIARDFDHAVQTDPTLFIHSDIDPNTSNIQFVGLHHDRTDGRIVLGTGKLIVSGTHGDAERPENAAAGMEVHGTNGLLVNSATANAVGGGFDGAESQTMYVSKINGEIVTTILVDIEDLVCASDQGTVIGETGIAAAYLTQITTAVNGLIYKVKMSCVEVPAGDDCTLDIDLFVNDTSIIGNASVGPVGSAPLPLITANANWASGVQRSTDDVTPLSATVDDFLYLVTGDAASSGGTYTAGKFIIKLYGASF